MKKLISSYLLTFLSFSAFADTLLQDKMQIHGFASQGFIQTTDNNFFGDSENGSFDFTELGINASFQLSPKIRLASQLISRRAGEMYNGSLWLDYALADINLVQGDNFQLGAYLGRIKNPLGLYNDTRDVAHTRQGVFTPQTIYFDKVRNISMSSDGIQFYGDYQFENGTLLVQGGIGFPIPDKNIEIVYMGQDWEGSLDNNDLALIGRIMYEYNGGEWIFALSGASLELDFDATLSDSMIPLIGFNDGVLAIDYTIVSLQHNAEKWQFGKA
ncbi:MAG: hypothetical protein IBX57_06645 [Gammaproteobacteria bacterium]|nr:hypothetical protein [Gammaproteobacteria bacterium]